MADRRRRVPRSTRWADRSLQTKSLVVVVVPVAILGVVLGTTFWFTHVDNRAQTIAGEARQIEAAATALDNTLLVAQNDVEEHLVSGSPAARSAYDRAASSVAPALDRLVALTPGNGAGQHWAPVIESDVAGLRADLGRLEVVSPSSAAGAATTSLLASTDAAAGRLRTGVASLVAEEDALIADQHDAVHTSSESLPVIAVVAVILALAGGIAVSLLFTSGVVTRLRRLERATDALERGDPPRDVPTGRDEIGRLSTRLLDATAQLRERAAERDRALGELENILTASPVVSLRYDVAGRRFSYASPNIERLLGMTPEEATARPGDVVARFHPESAAMLRDRLVAGAGRRGERLEITLRFRRDPSSEHWHEAEAVYTMDRGPGGELRGVVAYLVDVSERHQAQRAAEERRFLLESIFHASPDTIVVRDIGGRVVLASSTLAEVIGTSDTAATDLVEEAYRGGGAPHGDRARLDELIGRCIAGERRPDPVVTTGALPDGELRTYETRARPVLDQSGLVTGTVTVSRDVTERVRMEHSLRRASDEAERASAAKSEFLSRMSHELRTPLNAILGFAQLLELDGLPPDQDASVDQIQRAGHHLLALINEVLDISRIEAGRLSLSSEPVEVGDVLDEVTTLLAPVAEAAGIALAVDTEGGRDVRVRADRQRLLQVLLNLGSNALKYNSRGGAVSFRIGDAPGERVRFEVRDTGPGIPREQQDLLFVPFSRLGAERSAVEGTGVGLALSKQLVEVMGGAIGVESVPGHGSTFWVDLTRVEPFPEPGDDAAAPTGDGGPRPRLRPAADVPIRAGVAAVGGTGARADNGWGAAPGASAPRATTPRAPTPSRVVVLHIEDNPSNATLIEQILAKRPGVRLVSAAEGRSGLELARQHRPDLVLLDLHLPDLPGDELLHRLKAVPELADTKVVVVSADATPSRIRAMLDLGVEGYLTKPVDVEALLRLVDQEIGVQQSEPR